MKEIKEKILYHWPLGEVLDRMREFANQHQQAINGDLVMRLVDIGADYERMCDFVLRGFQDDKRKELYKSLQRRAYRLACDWDLSVLCSQPTGFYRDAARLTASFSPSHDDVRWMLESYVQNMAMQSLGQAVAAGNDGDATSADDIRAKHASDLNLFFSSLVIAPQWSRGDEEFYTSLLLSPTIDINDACTLVGALLLNGLIEPDYHKLGTLLSVYEQATEETLRQRALVALAFTMPRDVPDLFPEYQEMAVRFANNDATCQELLELQMQMVYSLNAEQDKDTIERDIMPGLMKNQGFRVTSRGIEMKEDDPMEDILHPDAQDKAMEELEATIGKMQDMEKRGADVYFGGFSKLKRFAFFYTLSNWFMPFSSEHPAIVKALNKSKDASGVISKLMEHAALCDSDKYSFALGFASVYENLPQQIRELVQQNNVSEMMVTNVEQMSATYIRRFYLQDLYRFFMLHPNRSELTSPFEVLQKDGKCFFARFASYSELLKQKASTLCRFLLKHDYLDAMEDALIDDMDDFSFLSGLLKHKRGDYEGSMVELRVALDDNPGDPAILKPLAYACYYNHEDEKAIEYYKQLTELDPDHSNAYELRIATILLEDEKVEESLNILYRLHFENEDDLRVRRALAWGLMLDKQLEQAQKHYEVLLEKPKPEDILNAGYCEWFQGKIARAVELFKRYMSITPVGDAAEMSDRQFLRNQFFDDLHLLNVYQIDEVDWTIMVDIVCS